MTFHKDKRFLSKIKMTEDKVRDASREILGIRDDIKGVKAGVGQLTTFNQLGFEGISDKPDGWYLPDNTNEVALILETKASKFDLQQQKFVDELLKNIRIAQRKYKKVVGILYNGNDVRIFKGENEINYCPPPTGFGLLFKPIYSQ